MPKAYAVVTYRSISNTDKLAAYAKLAVRRSLRLALASLLVGMQQLPVNRDLKSVR